MPSPVLLASRMQIRLNVIGTDGFEVYPTFAYVVKEILRLVRISRNDGRAELPLPHVLTQCNKRVIADVLLGNAGSPEGSLLRLRKRETGFVFMRSISVEKSLLVWRPESFLRINRCSA
jgi:hypothetical protein